MTITLSLSRKKLKVLCPIGEYQGQEWEWVGWGAGGGGKG